MATKMLPKWQQKNVAKYFGGPFFLATGGVARKKAPPKKKGLCCPFGNIFVAILATFLLPFWQHFFVVVFSNIFRCHFAKFFDVILRHFLLLFWQHFFCCLPKILDFCYFLFKFRILQELLFSNFSAKFVATKI